MAVDAGADALMIRSSWLGLHVPGFLPDYLFFPESPGTGGQDAAPVLREGPRARRPSGS